MFVCGGGGGGQRNTLAALPLRRTRYPLNRPVWTGAENLPLTFLTLGLDVSFQLHFSAALAPYNEPQIRIGKGTGWAVEIVRCKDKQNQLISSENRIPFIWHVVMTQWWVEIR